MEFIYAGAFVALLVLAIVTPKAQPLKRWRAGLTSSMIVFLGFAAFGFFWPEVYSVFGIRMEHGSVVPYLFTGIAAVELIILMLDSAISAFRKRRSHSS